MKRRKSEYTAALFQEGESWIAQCLDFDITGHGSHAIEALENLKQTILGQYYMDKKIDKTEPFSRCPATPKFYFDKGFRYKFYLRETQ